MTPEADGVVVAAGDQRRPRGRAERGRMELRVAQSHFRDAVHGGRRNDAAERAGDAVTLIVRHDQQDVGRTLRRNHRGRPLRLGFLAFRLISPPNGAADGGRYLPSMVVVALGDPGMPVICWACAVPAATWSGKHASATQRLLTNRRVAVLHAMARFSLLFGPAISSACEAKGSSDRERHACAPPHHTRASPNNTG